jgi:acyl-CoA thioester hydrolase
MYSKEFEVRWSDLDANRHLANSSYINFMSHTRLSYMMENGFGQQNMVKNDIGPVVFYDFSRRTHSCVSSIERNF